MNKKLENFSILKALLWKLSIMRCTINKVKQINLKRWNEGEKGIKGDCWSRFIHLLYDDVINKCRSCIRAIDITSSLNGLWTEISYCSLNGLISVFWAPWNKPGGFPWRIFSSIAFRNLGLSGRGNFSVLPLIPLDRLLERDYFRKCEAKFDIWFTYSGILSCDVNEFRHSFFHFPFSKCNTVKWQRD